MIVPSISAPVSVTPHLRTRQAPIYFSQPPQGNSAFVIHQQIPASYFAEISFILSAHVGKMRDEEAQRPQTSPSSSSSTSSVSSLSVKKDGSGFEGLFGRGKYKLWALAAIILLALWSMFTGSVTLKWSSVDLKRPSLELDPSINGDLDVLDVDEREKMVRQMWNTYQHSSIVRLPRFWRDAFGAAYQELTSEVAGVRNAALFEIAKMSFRSRDVYEPTPVESTTRASDEVQPRTHAAKTRKQK